MPPQRNKSPSSSQNNWKKIFSWGWEEKAIGRNKHPKTARSPKYFKTLWIFSGLKKIIPCNRVSTYFNYFLVNFSIYFPFRLCNGGELFDKIAEEQHFSESDAAKIMK